MIGRKIISRGQFVERLVLANRIIGREDNSSKDWWSKKIRQRIIGKKNGLKIN